jgi:ketosteroid isomerase-like protein
MNKPAAAIVALMSAIALSVLPSIVRAESGDEASIRALEDSFVAAVNAKNVNAIMKVYVPDESLLVFDVVPPRQYVGAKAYAKDWTDFLGMFKGSLKFEISDLSVTADGTMGFGHSIQRVSGTDTKGQPVDLTVRVTDVYRKINGNWLIVHEHVSVPVDLETGKPDVSSKP